MSELIKDPYFRVEVVNSTPDPNYTCWVGLHQCYAEGAAIDSPLLNNDKYDEDWFGEKVIEHALNHGHFSVCYDDQTEVLTSEGWKYWEDVESRDLLAAVDLSNYSIDFEVPQNLVEIEGVKSMYSVKGKGVDFCVTLDHNIVAEKRGSKDNKEIFHAASLIKAKDLLASTYRVRRSVNFKGTLNIDSNKLKLIGFWLGDGFTKIGLDNGIRFGLRLPRKIKYLKSLGFEVYEKVGDRYVIYNKELAHLLREFINSEGKYMPAWILQLDKASVLALLDGLKNSDGTNINKELFSFDNCNIQMLDMLQALISINGFAGNITSNGRPISDKHRPCKRLSITNLIYATIENCPSRIYNQTRDIIPYEGTVYCASVSTGALLTRRNGVVVVSGNCEHPSITLNVINYPHSCMQQITRHRVGVSPSVQSGRYTSKRFIDLAEYLTTSPSNADEAIEEVFYLRPVGRYLDRKGTKYNYSEEWRIEDLERCRDAVIQYSKDIKRGKSEEHARSLIPYDFRQNMILTFNMRSLMHVLGVRGLADTQLELQTLSHFMLGEFKEWSPIIGNWFEKKHYTKNRLAP